MKTNRTIIWMGVCVLIGAGIVVAGIFIVRGMRKNSATGQNVATTNTGCEVTKTEDTVSGQSMDGILSDGQKITVLENYYACNAVKRNDVVVYKFGVQGDRLVKSVKALPGDTFDLKQNGNVWNLLVNGSAVQDSKGENYELDTKGYTMLSLYKNDYKGVLPDKAYIILGNIPSGSLDSTRFGLVSGSDFIGKVEL